MFFRFLSVTDTCCFTFVLSDRASGGHLDLMQLIGVPLPPSVSFVPGFEGFPAYSFGPDANIGRLTATFLPGSFYRDFSIIVTVSRHPFRVEKGLPVHGEGVSTHGARGCNIHIQARLDLSLLAATGASGHPERRSPFCDH